MTFIQMVQYPILIKSMSLSQKLSAGLQITLFAMVLVIFILIVLMIAVKLMGKIFEKKEINQENSEFEEKNNITAIENGSMEKEHLAVIISTIKANNDFQKNDYRIKNISKLE